MHSFFQPFVSSFTPTQNMARSRATTPVAETLAAASRRNPRRVNAPDRLGFETPKATTTTKIAKATPKKTVAKKVTGVTKVSRPKAMPKSKVSAKKPSPTKKSSPSKKIPAGTRPAYGHLLSGGQDFVGMYRPSHYVKSRVSRTAHFLSGLLYIRVFVVGLCLAFADSAVCCQIQRCRRFEIHRREVPTGPGSASNPESGSSSKSVQIVGTSSCRRRR